MTANVKKDSIFNRPKKDYVNPYFGGIILGLVLFISILLSGNGLGASGALSRIDAGIVDAIAPAHVDTNSYLLKMAGGDKNPFDDWIIPLFFGSILGGFSSGILNGRFKFETNRGPQITDKTRWLMAFLGGILFVYGARMARGCTSGQALTGGATLSAGSWVIMLSIFAGAYAVAYFVRKLWN